jgi:hypothetical protein
VFAQPVNVSMNQRGTALVSTLGVAMILLPLGAFVVLQCRMDVFIQRNMRAEIEAFYVADAGLEHAVAEISPAQSFDDLLVGPDGIAATGDDGVFPFAEGAPPDFPFAPFRYAVRVSKGADGVLHLVSQGSGLHGATKVVEALLTRSPQVFTPAGLYAEGDATNLDMGSAGFLLSGFDHRSTDLLETATGTAAAVPALGSAEVNTATVLGQRLASAAAQRLLGAGGTPSLATTPALDVAAYAARVDGRSERVRLSAATLTGPVVLGTASAPQISIVDGDVDISSPLTGNGILVIQGALHVTGTIVFSGLVLAMGSVVFEAASSVTVMGALWRGAAGPERVDLLGSGGIVYSSAALAGVDAAFPGLLPHAAVLAGWQEQL